MTKRKDTPSPQLQQSEMDNAEGSPTDQEVNENRAKRQRTAKTSVNLEESHESTSSDQHSQFVSSSNTQPASDAERTSSLAGSRWETKRPFFDHVFAETRQTQCYTCGDCEGDLVRCVDCGPGVMRCMDCTLSYHKECHLLHKPELVLETCVRPFPLRSRFVRQNHQCSTPHTKSIQVFDEKGRIHDCWFTSCSCEPPSATLLRWNLWPASPDQPRVAIHEDLLRWFESLLVEGGMSLKLASEVVRRKNSLDVQEADFLFMNLTSGCFEEYQHFRRRYANHGHGLSAARNRFVYTGSPKSSVNALESDSRAPVNEEVRGHRTFLDPDDDLTRVTSHTPFPHPAAFCPRMEEQSHVVFPGTPVHNSFLMGGEPGTATDQTCQEWKVESLQNLDGDDDSETEYILVPANKVSMSGLDCKPAAVAAHERCLAEQAIAIPGMPPGVEQHPSRPTLPNTSDIVIMPSSNDGKTRVWDKKQYCLYCRAPYAKLPRHLEGIHRDEPDIVLLRNAKCPDERRHLLSKLRNLGNHLQNCDVLRRGVGALIVVKRPSCTETRLVADYSPCPICFGYYIINDLRVHSCPLKNIKIDKSAVWLNLTLQQ
ncbi:uncharacterized protein LOC110975088 [Acanthaster planci]|uniref:Uncharacterized protein LOC110975088 n=1 Tax=Acanthaster planci TaxID=133434 RepID=A0A8B7XQ24_ACAPL|nr:uncharacterized protein LOC110975088 [Acanthaster planci]XP_022082923.1 uncharacterized protein LOC110975088 [Acanthaster planci]